ncbi:MAG TPA: discoidin domain-containing protein [Arachnia sp.]|nr:discoidin domain-containing protein [Arachnia sp.]HMT85510.1 discoidin domain-containing protein [Arachnia sp.]
MVARLPDDFFRRPPGESTDAGPGAPPPRPGGGASGWRPRVPRRHHPGFAVRTVVAMSLLSVLGGFAVGNAVWFNAGEPSIAHGTASSGGSLSEDHPTASGAPQATAAPDLTVPYSGSVDGVQAVTAISSCTDGSDPGRLIDGDLSSVWRCPGDGRGETVQFTIDVSRPLVGVRLINGNISDDGRYHAERRILTVRWTMLDGSRFEQGLSGNDPSPQEVRFPPATIGWMSLAIVDSTVPGEASEEANAVSLAGVEFLYPAE